MEESFSEKIISLYQKIHPLDRIPRAGYLLRGVESPESVAAHSHFLSLLTLLFVEKYPGRYRSDKAMAMALIHDLAESVLMDIPMPAGNRYLKDVKKKAEEAIFADLMKDFSDVYTKYFRELMELSSEEAKLVTALDKAQMMIKVLCYQKEGRGNLNEFWENPSSFKDYGIDAVSDLFDALCRIAGKKRPT